MSRDKRNTRFEGNSEYLTKWEPLSRTEVDRLLEAARNSRHYCLFLLLASTGIRNSEALALTWQDLDLPNATMTVRRGLQWHHGTYFMESRPYEQKAQLTADLVHRLSELSRVHPLVFARDDGSPVHAEVLSKRLQELAGRAAISRKVRLNDLRHATARSNASSSCAGDRVA